MGGLWPPFFNRKPMFCIGYAKSVPDKGLLSIDRPRPLTRLRGVYHRAALRADPLAKPPSPTRGEGKGRSLLPRSRDRPDAPRSVTPQRNPLRGLGYFALSGIQYGAHGSVTTTSEAGYQ
jgi:hypothetical protein